MTATPTSTSTRSSTPTTTSAAVITGFGGPDQLHIAEVPLSKPTPTEVLVEVAAAAVNPVDLSTRTGLIIPESDARFPMVLGWDVVGTVVALGGPETGFQVGDRVAAMVFQPIDQRGTYAAHVSLSADLLARVPDELSLQLAATVPLAGLTAAQLVDQVRSGGARSLLMTGALGAVGRGVVALAARAGLHVVGAVAAERAQDLLDLGARSAVSRSEFTAEVRAQFPDGVDAAIDLVGGASAQAAFTLVKDGGRYATAVPSYIDDSGPFETSRGIDLHVHTVSPDVAQLKELLGLAAQGVLPAKVAATYPLAEAALAHQLQAAGGRAGRVLLLP